MQIYKSIYEESNEGWIWISSMNGIKSRQLIHVKNTQTDKSIYVSCRIIDNDFIKIYNAGNNRKKMNLNNSMVISSYYRDLLEINENVDISTFEIKLIEKKQICKKIQFLTKHPDLALRLATELAIISVTIGFVSILISIICEIIE